MKGKSADEVTLELREAGKSEEEIARPASFKRFKGNMLSNSILVRQLTPRTLGSLIAMYEHKIFTQGIMEAPVGRE
jgi:glucose-6-phosphate isomerase